jgi:N-(2-amino-2-carboxyethyl)-L-glutamate synthase
VHLSSGTMTTLGSGVGDTPLIPLHVRRGRQQATALLKLESANPTGSVKDRTALGLIRAMNQIAPLLPSDIVIESTSGNLGLALAQTLNQMGCRFIAVTDLNTPEETRQALTEAGADLVVVTEPDGKGGYLLNRLRAVRQLCIENPSYRWSNQYENPANPGIHEELTGPEILKQAGSRLDAVYIAVSTGGTLAGVSRCIRSAAPDVRLVAVDAEGSLATARRSGRRLLSGIGASRPSSFLRPGSYDAAIAVPDISAIAVCRMLLSDTGLDMGGSSGSVLSACLDELFGPRAPRTPVCLLADGGQRYRNTIYSDGWLREKDRLNGVRQRVDKLRAEGLSFRLAEEKEETT